MNSLEGKNVLVTGGGSGIGYTIAHAFEAAGAMVWVCDIDRDRIDELNASGRKIRGQVADAGSEQEVDDLFVALRNETDGKLDILINNAGISGPNGPLETLPLQSWLDTLRVNLISTFLCCRQALPAMKERRSGSIVNLSSTAGTHGYPLRTPYASAKWGIIGLTKSLAMEVGGYGIRVNAICPGPVSGARMDRVIDDEAKTRGVDQSKVREQFVSQISLKSFVEAEDIAQMALFICSKRGAKISGQALSVDGNTESLSLID
ncbi:MAG: SDR family oxidoreductase [Acidiferrobacterales bacterium]|nr:SDR family oxidoreductase [Acidiferrobacterales bacterium]